MKALSLKLKEDVFEEAEKISGKVHMARNAYINAAVFFFNKLNRRKLLKKQLVKESEAVYGVSLEVLKELEQIEDDLS